MEASGWAYTEALSELYPTRADVAAEIAELEGRLTLPRSTELFASDIHGEYNAFSHVLRGGSGAVRALIEEVFGSTPVSYTHLDVYKRQLLCYGQEKSREGNFHESSHRRRRGRRGHCGGPIAAAGRERRDRRLRAVRLHLLRQLWAALLHLSLIHISCSPRAATRPTP